MRPSLKSQARVHPFDVQIVIIGAKLAKTMVLARVLILVQFSLVSYWFEGDILGATIEFPSLSTCFWYYICQYRPKFPKTGFSFYFWVSFGLVWIRLNDLFETTIEFSGRVTCFWYSTCHSTSKFDLSSPISYNSGFALEWLGLGLGQMNYLRTLKNFKLKYMHFDKNMHSRTKMCQNHGFCHIFGFRLVWFAFLVLVFVQSRYVPVRLAPMIPHTPKTDLRYLRNRSGQSTTPIDSTTP